MKPTVTVVGAGAMGALFGARLALAGFDTELVEVAPEVVERINRDGVVIREGAEERRVEVPATANPDGARGADVVIVLVKSHATERAVESIRPALRPDTVVLSLQNGWGNADRLAPPVDPDQLFLGVTYHSASLAAPGVVDHTATGPTYIGTLNGTADERGERLESVLRSSGFDTHRTDAIGTVIWRKLILNSAANGTAALTGLRSGALAEVPEVFKLMTGLADEVISVASALGYEFDRGEALEDMRAMLLNASRAKSSMRQDVEAGRSTEIEVINGAVLREAARNGLEVPLNRAMYALIRGYESARLAA